MSKKWMCLILSAMLTMTFAVPVLADDNTAVTVTSAELPVTVDSISTDKATGGDVSASGGQATLNVVENVEVNYSGNQAATGIEVSAGSNGSAAVTVGGSVNVDAGTSGTDAKGIDIDASGNSTVNVNVEGSVMTENPNSGTDSNAIELSASGANTEINARIGRDIEGSHMASTVEIETQNGAQVNVVAEGTLSAGAEAAVAFTGNPNDVSLIIWKAETSPDGSIVKEIVSNGGGVTLEQTGNAVTLENAIHYILRVDTTQNITLENTTGMTYTAPDGTVLNYNTAKEGQRVAVRLNIPAGYALQGVYSDEARNCSLTREGGNYYLIVPKGGGVYVNMWLVEQSTPSSNPAGIPETTTENQASEPVPADPGLKMLALNPFATNLSPTPVIESSPILSMERAKTIKLMTTLPNGSNGLMLNWSFLQESGIRWNCADVFVIKTANGEVRIPMKELQDYLLGKGVTFILNNDVIEVYDAISGKLIKSYYLAPEKIQEKILKNAQYDVSKALEQVQLWGQEQARRQQTLQQRGHPKDSYQEKYSNAVVRTH